MTNRDLKERATLTDALPFGDPAVAWLHHGDHSVKVGACAIKHLVAVVSQVQKVLAVVASLLVELVKRLLIGQI